MSIELRRAADRLESRADGIVSRHSFAFGPHYDPMNTRFGALVTHNDDVLARGAGFPEHPHRDLEIVTWVVAGGLEHHDSAGGSGIVRPGTVGRLSTGAGVRHSETNASSGETRYVQMWVLPDAEGLPSYQMADVSHDLESGAFVVVASGSAPASGSGSAPISLRRSDATFLVARLPAGSSAALPVTPLLHVFVALGAVTLAVATPSGTAEKVPMSDGDGARVRVLGADAVRRTDARAVTVVATSSAEVLVWAMAAEVGKPRAL